MKMSRFGATNAAESAKHDAATTPRLPASPSMLSSRLNAFVRPTSQSIPIAQPSVGLETNSTEIELVQHDERGRELGAELRSGVEVDDVVEEAEREHDRAARHDSEHLAGDPDRADRGREQDGDREAGEDADRRRTPGVGLVCQRSGRGSAPNARSARGQRSRPAMTKKAIGAAARAASAFTLQPVGGGRRGIDRRSLTRSVGGHGRRQHPPYNPPVAVYADLIRYRELFASLFQRDLRAKYKGSALGLLWTLALPVTLMLVYLVVFSVLWNSPTTDVDHYWLFLLCGLPPWVFFATSLQSSARSLLENASLIRKVRFPRQLVPLSIVATQLVAFVVMTGIVLVLVDDRPAGLARNGVARDPDRRRDRAVRLRALARGRLGERDLPRHRVRRRGAAAAAVLPHAGALQPRHLPGADAHPWLLDLIQWGNPLTPVVECFRAPLFLGEVPSTGDLVYLVVETVVALALGAVIFTSVDDRIAAEV